MLSLERKNFILKLLDEKASVSVADLSKRLDVSEVTVRKMLNGLARQGLLHRTRGGAVSLSLLLRENDMQTKERANIRKKRDIAAQAYQLIDDYDSVYIDAGTTTLELVRLIKNGRKRNVTVVTNALNIALELVDSQDIEVILTGGRLRHKVISCVGPIATGAVESLSFDKAFIGANSVSLKVGAATPDMTEAEIKRRASRAAAQSYLVCDSSKFRGFSMAKIHSLQEFAGVITDSALPENTARELRRADIPLMIAIAHPSSPAKKNLRTV